MPYADGYWDGFYGCLYDNPYIPDTYWFWEYHDGFAGGAIDGYQHPYLVY